MTLKGMMTDLSRTMASDKIQLLSYLNTQLPFTGASNTKPNKAEDGSPEAFPAWEEETDLAEEAQALVQRVRPQAAQAAEKPLRQSAPRVPEGRTALRQAVVFSEIIGEPVCRRRKRKAYGNQGNFGRR